MTYRTFFKYRNIWMVFAIFCVIMVHVSWEINDYLLKFITYYGSFSIDIFMFASGIGCWFSYKKHGYKVYIKHRAERILPSFMPFIILWCAINFFKGKLNAMQVIGNLLMLDIFMPQGSGFNWYITAIWILYLATPVLAALCDWAGEKKMTALCAAVLAVISIPTIKYSIGCGTHLLTTRIPIFLIGMSFARQSTLKEKISLRTEVLFYAYIPVYVFLMIFISKKNPDALSRWGLYWYPAILFVPGLCMLISRICTFAEKVSFGKFTVKTVRTIGAYTFEIYLVHVWSLDIMRKYIDMYCPDWKRAALLFVVSTTVFTFALVFVSKGVKKLIALRDKKQSVLN